MGSLADDYDAGADRLAPYARGRSFLASDNFIISCGCVTVDPQASKVLLIRNRKLDIYQLPKGRKNIGEDLLTAALRETYEETGVQVRPLAAMIATRATPMEGAGGLPETPEGSPAPSGRCELTKDRLNHEPCAITHWMDPCTGALKHVFYFLAQGDSTLLPGADTQEPWESFDTTWVDADSAVEMLAFKEDGMVVQKALDDVRRSGMSI